MAKRWIPEKEAAKKLGYAPRTLRRYAKEGKWDISFTSIQGRKYQYDEVQVLRLLDQNARIIA